VTERAPADVDAGDVYRHPLLVVYTLTLAAGAVDAIGFARFGVFTSNQAGNLVIGWTLLPSQPQAALLCLMSIVGCGTGVALAVLLRRAVPGLGGPRGAPVLLVSGAVLVVAAVGLGAALVPDPLTTPPEVGTAAWARTAVAVWSAAAALALLATVYVSGAGVRAPILASTNAYMDAVRHGVTAVAFRTGGGWGRRARIAAGFPLAWTLGAAATVLLPFTDGVLAAGACGLVVLAGLLARRVTVDPSGTDRTV
jgi:uncharacterized membrane protein YoaK (UPF0700 family)